MAWTIALSDADISSLTTAYTMASGSEGRMSASFTNRSTSATATVQLWVVPNGETRGNEHLKEAGTTLGLAGTPQANLERFFVVPAGAVVFVQASTANVSCQVQGDVVSTTGQTVTDYTSSISWGTNWSNWSSQTTLKVQENGFCSLTIAAEHAGGTNTGVIATLPSVAWPTKGKKIPCVVYSGGVYITAFAEIYVNGQVISPASFDGATAVPSPIGPNGFVWINMSYFV